MISSLFEERLDAAQERLRRVCMPRDDMSPDGTSSDEDGSAGNLFGLPPAVPGWPGRVRLAQLAAGGDRLACLVQEFGLAEDEAGLLVTCLLPEINPACGAAVRYLSGLPTSRPTVAVALSVHGIEVPDALSRGLLREGSSLFDAGLVAYENPDEPYPDRVLRVPDRVLDFLVGRDAGPSGGRWLRPLPDSPGHPAPAQAVELAAAIAADPHQTWYLRQGILGEALPAARAALAETGLAPLLLDPDALAAGEDSPARLAERAALEARLLGSAILVPVPAPGTTAPERGDLLRQLVARLAEEPRPLLLYGSQAWAAYEWEAPVPSVLDLRSADSRRPCDQLGAAASAAVERVHRTAALRASAPVLDEVRVVARQRSASELGSLARHIVPQVGRQDLVLPPTVRTRLDMLVARARHREWVFRTWGLRRGGGRGEGTAALFAGESGTGKTMAAEAVAHELGLDLYVISLPSIVSKYIGETEKNLERVFSAAETLDAVVLFDEADSMFAKRGEVKSSNDRHANMQSGYLLQRLEAFNGLAILTTNLRSNIDTAFTRRFDEVIHFESPAPEVRAQLWHSFLGDAAPDDLSVEALAQAYDLAGGNIRACVESAVFAAAAEQRPLTGEHILRGIETEYGKLGRLFSRVHHE